MNEQRLTAKEHHRQAEELRESDKHSEALKELDQAIVLYQEDKDYLGICEALQSRVLTFKHLYFLTRDTTFAIIAQKEAEASLEVAQQHDIKDKLSSCYFRLGEIAMIFEDFSKAINWYQRALENYQGSLSEKGDYRYHLGEALYRNGRKEEGKKAIFEGLSEIQKGASEVDPFLVHVWESGLHMKLADLLRGDEPDEARKHLDTSREIADSDPKLIIRRRQIEELSKSFKS
ncbi:hypothetical protein A3F62_04820 [Candidatus Woesebacteria bacterium RIFCSPHIGHO2_12_FULL_44_11]|nr:MAG: hypothetical protein A3F62_04820 [Candidatus Woesebacteria bacterium RIFCSPHIGHO2_12_FULL_44_11]